jgi:hypothetical protein
VSAAVAPQRDEDEAPGADFADVGDVEVFVHLPAPLHAALRRRAHREGRTMAAVMRAALCAYLDQAPRS